MCVSTIDVLLTGPVQSIRFLKTIHQNCQSKNEHENVSWQAEEQKVQCSGKAEGSVCTEAVYAEREKRKVCAASVAKMVTNHNLKRKREKNGSKYVFRSL